MKNRKRNCENEVRCQKLAVPKISILCKTKLLRKSIAALKKQLSLKIRDSEKEAYSKSSCSRAPCETN